MQLLLASGSPRRAELLRQIGVSFTVLSAPDIDETPDRQEAPLDYVSRMAREKAAAGAGNVTDAVVLGADTAVILDGRILGKPVDASHSLSMLEQLNGQTHQVISAVCIDAGGQQQVRTSITDVRFRQLPPAMLQSYVATGEGADKAGGYGIQGLGAVLVAAINGSYSGVVGLPLEQTVILLEGAGIPYWQQL
ncbi:MAG: nucleoside triphosphate pyrophosphatase [Alcanivorax sp.]|nr:nucleoside triphosphate pyrophosphatase [Alcanivorax sp.]